MALTEKKDEKKTTDKNAEQAKDVSGTQTTILEQGETEKAPEQVSKESLTQSEPSVPLSEVKKMMEDLKNDLQKESDDKMKSFIKDVQNAKTTRSEKQDDKDYLKDLSDDYLDEPVVFFSYKNFHVIGGDYRKGAEVPAPNGKIIFQTVFRQKKKGERGDKVVSVSSVKIESKRELDFLKNHTMFNVDFFESMDVNKTVDSHWAQKLVEANASIARLNDLQIVARCQDMGIKKETSVDSMRKKLIAKIAEQYLSYEETQNRSVSNRISSTYEKSDGDVFREVRNRTVPD